jgi:hypothetical protein
MPEPRITPPSCEPDCIQKARAALDVAASHPDAAEIGQALDALSLCIRTLAPLENRICDAAAREAIAGDVYGMLGTLKDSVADLAWALECWTERPENSAAALRAADYADWCHDNREDAA